MNVFSIAGWSGSGKTTLITRLIKHFKSKNKRVVALKSAAHKVYLEPESTDTFRFLEAGADEACLAGANELMTMKRIVDKTETFAILEKQYADVDILLLEGLRRDDIPLIEVFDSGNQEALKFPVETLCAIVADKPVSRAVPYFHYDEIEKIAGFMEETMEQTVDHNVCLKVNGKEIPLNPFVTEVFYNVINGLVDSLGKIPPDKNTIEIRIEKEENK